MERAGARAATAASKIRDGAVEHRQELTILLGTLVFAVVVGLLGAAAVTSY